MLTKQKKLALENNINEQVMTANNRLGIIHFFKGEHEKSVSFYYKNIEVAKATGKKEKVANVYYNIAIAEFSLGNYYKCIKSCYEALSFLDENNLYRVRVYRMLASVYERLQKYNKGVEILLKAIKIIKLKKERKRISKYLNINLNEKN